ncbi:MAG: UDP-N-acetylglucosamine 1-carboxyvinyltransferase [Clostridia bacterium]|nr:UDP-N-acetylglucosamine 1-carboxyvinyltransferase [Clostridia bacterium]
MCGSYIITGGKKLEGEISASGSKNASLPILAASILNNGITKLYNVPNIHDTKVMIEILRNLGCKVKRVRDKIVIDSREVKKYEIPEELMRKMRSSVILAGALIGRFKNATFCCPGGCDIGARPIDLHLKAFENLGINITKNTGYIHCTCDTIVGEKIHLDFPSVGATQNAMLVAVLAKGTTIISNAAMEPEIVDLQNFLNKMGAKITGAGTKEITIKGVEKLNNTGYKVMPDRIEAGTLLCAVATTGGKVRLNKVVPEHLTPVLEKLKECGCEIEEEKDAVILQAPKKLKAVDIKTMPYPGFPTDMQAIFVSLLCTAKGTSIITENIFENRYKYTNELKRMGAKIMVEGRTAIIKGTRKLNKAVVEATDLRGGAALILAALNASGKTEVNNIEYILRGYENLDQKLNALGAKITKEVR